MSAYRNLGPVVSAQPRNKTDAAVEIDTDDRIWHFRSPEISEWREFDMGEAVHHARALGPLERNLGAAAMWAEQPRRIGKAIAFCAARQDEFAIVAPRPEDFRVGHHRSEEHTSELQSLMRISYAVFCLKKKINKI